MGFFDRFRGTKAKAEGASDLLGMGFDDGAAPGEGGPSFVATDLAHFRYLAQAEAVNLGRAGLRPEDWPELHMQFPFEKALASEHEGLRTRLRNRVGGMLRDAVGTLFSISKDIATIRNDLRVADEQLAAAVDAAKPLQVDLSEDINLAGRYFALFHQPTKWLRWLVAVAFILGEWAMTSFVFEGLTEDAGIQTVGLGYILSLGIVVFFVAVPHYIGKGIKQGVFFHHASEYDIAKLEGARIDPNLDRMYERERVGDLGFRVASFVAMGLLFALAVPLSMVRANDLGAGDDGTTRLLFFVFLFVQLGISAYFFLVEWYAYDPESAFHEHAEARLGELKAERSAVFAALTDATGAFYAAAEEVKRIVEQAPQWDHYVVAHLQSTIDFHRQVLVQQLPDLQPLIVLAPRPFLGSEDEVADEDAELIPMHTLYPELDADDPTGVRWWLVEANEALRDQTGGTVAFEDPGWAVTRNPYQILAVFLASFGIPVDYRIPPELDPLGESLPAPVSTGRTPAPPTPAAPTAAAPTTAAAGASAATGTPGGSGGDGAAAAAGGPGNVTPLGDRSSRAAGAGEPPHDQGT